MVKIVVGIYDINGRKLYSHLFDDGTNVMKFADYGFVTKDQCKANKWEIRPEK